jgi:hypothetical protein
LRWPVIIGIIIMIAKLLLPTEQREAQALVTFAAKAQSAVGLSAVHVLCGQTNNEVFHFVREGIELAL